MHWSIDFVEHLRAVHFALATASVTVLILTLSAREQPVKQAWTQATQILELQERWLGVENGLYQHAAKQLGLPTTKTYYLDVDVPTDIRKSGHTVVELSVSEGFFSRYAAEFVVPHLNTVASLNQFRVWWNTLHAGLPISIPDLRPSPDKCYVGISHTYEMDGQGVAKLLPPVNEQPCKVSDRDESSVGDRVHLTIPDVIAVYPATTAKIQGTQPMPPETGGSGAPSERNQMLASLITPAELAVVTERALHDEYFSDWRTGPFDVAFAELNSVAATNGLQTLALKDLPTRVQELQPKGDPTIEALGLKIPADNLTRWGIPLLLAVQLYFWIHLHEFKRKVEPDAPGRDVAWIGAYRTWPAAVVALLSACLLPLAAILVLGLRLPSDLPREGHRYLGIAITALTVLSSAVLAVGTAERLIQIRRNFFGNQMATRAAFWSTARAACARLWNFLQIWLTRKKSDTTPPLR
jgi:hypothetical protein